MRKGNYYCYPTNSLCIQQDSNKTSNYVFQYNQTPIFGVRVRLNCYTRINSLRAKITVGEHHSINTAAPKYRPLFPWSLIVECTRPHLPLTSPSLRHYQMILAKFILALPLIMNYLYKLTRPKYFPMGIDKSSLSLIYIITVCEL